MSKIPKILEDMYLKNLAFFKDQNPQIHNVISNTTPDHSKIIINDEGAIDLNYNGRRIYCGDHDYKIQCCMGSEGLVLSVHSISLFAHYLEFLY